ncbi:hypothetical protein OEZ86_003649 [Tetradesmus obliquus]|nr:hypothetical protein OEZ86_003649 [Tetradesmus obliquus]
METAFNDLEIACLLRVFSFLTPKDCACASCVHPLWNSVAGDNAVWKPHLAADYAASSAAAPDGSEAATYRAAYAAWHTAYADVAGPLLARTLACWRRIEAYLQQHSPQILATLNPGATAQQVAQAEAELGHPLPLAVRCIYRVHNGQDLRLHQRGASGGPPPNLLMGLFGCLIFYDHVTSNALQSLEEMVQKTALFRSIRPMGARHPLLPSNHVVFAHSFKPNDKVCVLDAGTGGVYQKLPHSRDWPLAPAADTYPGACDGMLRWMEEYARRLSEGWYGGCESDSSVKGPLEEAGITVGGAISLFPRAYPAAATAITRGVQVRQRPGDLHV